MERKKLCEFIRYWTLIYLFFFLLICILNWFVWKNAVFNERKFISHLHKICK